MQKVADNNSKTESLSLRTKFTVPSDANPTYLGADIGIKDPLTLHYYVLVTVKMYEESYPSCCLVVGTINHVVPVTIVSRYSMQQPQLGPSAMVMATRLELLRGIAADNVSIHVPASSNNGYVAVAEVDELVAATNEGDDQQEGHDPTSS